MADFKADAAPGSGMNPFIMNEEGVGRLFAARKLVDGPFPEHYEPLESPIGTNPLHPKVVQSPAIRLFDSVKERIGTHEKFPYVGTTLPSDRAFPVLDQIGQAADDCPAGTVCRNQ